MVMMMGKGVGDDVQQQRAEEQQQWQEESLSVRMRTTMTSCWMKETMDVWGQTEGVEAAVAAVVFLTVGWRCGGAVVVGRTSSCRRRMQWTENDEERRQEEHDGTQMTDRVAVNGRAGVAQHGGRDGYDALRTC